MFLHSLWIRYTFYIIYSNKKFTAKTIREFRCYHCGSTLASLYKSLLNIIFIRYVVLILIHNPLLSESFSKWSPLILFNASHVTWFHCLKPFIYIQVFFVFSEDFLISRSITHFACSSWPSHFNFCNFMLYPSTFLGPCSTLYSFFTLALCFPYFSYILR